LASSGMKRLSLNPRTFLFDGILTIDIVFHKGFQRLQGWGLFYFVRFWTQITLTWVISKGYEMDLVFNLSIKALGKVFRDLGFIRRGWENAEIERNHAFEERKTNTILISCKTVWSFFKIISSFSQLFRDCKISWFHLFLLQFKPNWF
jgi:hypothetical protein